VAADVRRDVALQLGGGAGLDLDCGRVCSSLRCASCASLGQVLQVCELARGSCCGALLLFCCYSAVSWAFRLFCRVGHSCQSIACGVIGLSSYGTSGGGGECYVCQPRARTEPSVFAEERSRFPWPLLGGCSNLRCPPGCLIHGARRGAGRVRPASRLAPVYYAPRVALQVSSNSYLHGS
jgi:hypothetical protein